MRIARELIDKARADGVSLVGPDGLLRQVTKTVLEAALNAELEMPAAEVADRFGYSTVSAHQIATLLRSGKMALFAETRPGPKGPRKAKFHEPRDILVRAGEPGAHCLNLIEGSGTERSLPFRSVPWQAYLRDSLGAVLKAVGLSARVAFRVVITTDPAPEEREAPDDQHPEIRRTRLP